MRRILIVAIAVVAVAVVAPVALGGQANPHFIGTPTCDKNTNGSLTCSGKAAGLDSLPTQAFLTASKAEAVYQCQNRGGNLPPGQPLSSGQLIGPKQDITPHNGNIVFSPTLNPPPAPNVGDVCPNGKNWRLVRLSLTYFDVTLHIQQGTTDVLTYSFGTIDP